MLIVVPETKRLINLERHGFDLNDFGTEWRTKGKGRLMKRSIDWVKAADLSPEELDRLLEADHDEVDDNLPPNDAQLAAAQPGKRRPGQRGPGKRPAKVLLTLRVDPATLEAWKATGQGWQTKMSDLLARRAPRP